MRQSCYRNLFKLTKKLISFKSITPQQSGCINYLEQYLEKIGFTLYRLDRNDTTNLLAVYGKLSKINIAFAGHIDVVPPGEISKWDNDPFVLTEKDDLLYGRGIADMKGAVAAFIIACEEYLKINQNGSIAILLTSDEEGAAKDGTCVIVEYLKLHKIKLKWCIIGEPSSKDKLGDNIKFGRRGSANVNIEIFGKQGHVAYPHLCQNPIHLFAPIMYKLSELIWDIGNDFFPPTSLQFTNINSGFGVNNIIPGSLTASFNIRYNNLHTIDGLKNKLSYYLDEHKLNYVVNWVDSAQPFLSTCGDLIKLTKASIKKITGINAQISTDGGTSDGRFLIDVCDELVEIGLSNSSAHQVNERVKKSELIELANIYSIILNKVFNG